MKILAIETATEACSAALLVSGTGNGYSTDNLSNNNIISRFQLAPREHTKLILSMMDEVLEEGSVTLSDLDAIAFSRGPGAFTGLRIAAGVAQGVAFSLDLPVAPVSTLAALAFSAVDMHDLNEGSWQDKLIIASLDARMGEVYWGVFIYQDNMIQSIAEEQVTKPEEMMASVNNRLKNISENTPIVAIGSGWDAYESELLKSEEVMQLSHIKNVFPSAEFIVKLALPMLSNGETVPAEDAQPVYIRNKVAEKSKKKLA